MITEHQRQLLDRLFAEAVTLPPEQRANFLAEKCDDPEVLREVESLLAFAKGPLSEIADAIGQAAGEVSGSDLGGQRVGAYRLTGLIGHGGMGAVYRGVRDDDEFRQTVAVKLLRFPDGDPVTLRRFRDERQILASLENPHIARLFDGGSWVPPGTTESQPYIVMEYIEGLPLTAYCQKQNLAIRQRLALFRQACEALSYAHRQLVIHRDVKPANMLVTADGTLKLLDFGVAKLLDLNSGLDAHTRTSTGLGAMTPDYASPEQVRGEAVSTLTDVYSLGAVLYELLCGRRPHQLSGLGAAEIAREICNGEVLPPSKVGERSLGNDLDVIVLKAMHKEPTRRYQSVEQLSEDIRRYLEGLPIMARPDTLTYRTGKFIRRHRLGLVAAGAVFLAIVGGAAASLWEAKRANNEAATAKAINDFLQNDLLSQAGPSAQSGSDAKPDADLKVRTALDRAAVAIAGKFPKQPSVEASLRQTIGNAYHDLGLYPEAQQQLERAVELHRRILGAHDPGLLASVEALATVYLQQDRVAEAEALLKGVVEEQTRKLGKEHATTLSTMSDLAVAYEEHGKYAESSALFSKVLEAQRRVLGPEHPDTLNTMNNLGMSYRLEGKYREAEPLYVNSLEIKRRRLGVEHPNTLTTMNNLATLYSFEDKEAQAEDLYKQVLEARRRVLGPDHPLTLVTMNNLAGAYREEGKLEDARVLSSQALEAQQRRLGMEHTDTLKTMGSLAVLYRLEGKYAESEAMLTKLLEMRRRVQGEEHPDTLSTMYSLGQLFALQAQYGKAETLMAKVLETRRRVLGPQHPDSFAVLVSMGGIRLKQQKYPEAEQLLREALTAFEKSLPDTWQRYATQNMLGESVEGQGRYAEAEPLLLGGYQGMIQRESQIPFVSRSRLTEAAAAIDNLYRLWQKPEMAATWRNHIERNKLAGRTQ